MQATQQTVQKLARPFSIGKEITLQSFSSLADLKCDLRNVGVSILPTAMDLIKQDSFQLTTPEGILSRSVGMAAHMIVNYELVAPSLAELGLDGELIAYDEIVDAARSFELYLCPMDFALHLRRAYMDQPDNEAVVVASMPITGSDGKDYLFLVNVHNNRPHLGTQLCDNVRAWSSETRVVFVKRRWISSI